MRKEWVNVVQHQSTFNYVTFEWYKTLTSIKTDCLPTVPQSFSFLTDCCLMVFDCSSTVTTRWSFFIDCCCNVIDCCWTNLTRSWKIRITGTCVASFICCKIMGICSKLTYWCHLSGKPWVCHCLTKCTCALREYVLLYLFTNYWNINQRFCIDYIKSASFQTVKFHSVHCIPQIPCQWRIRHRPGNK